MEISQLRVNVFQIFAKVSDVDDDTFKVQHQIDLIEFFFDFVVYLLIELVFFSSVKRQQPITIEKKRKKNQ